MSGNDEFVYTHLDEEFGSNRKEPIEGFSYFSSDVNNVKLNQEKNRIVDTLQKQLGKFGFKFRVKEENYEVPSWGMYMTVEAKGFSKKEIDLIIRDLTDGTAAIGSYKKLLQVQQREKENEGVVPVFRLIHNPEVTILNSLQNIHQDRMDEIEKLDERIDDNKKHTISLEKLISDSGQDLKVPGVKSFEASKKVREK